MNIKEEKKVVMHQHTNNGVPCGKAHPIDAFHEKDSTRAKHNTTILAKGDLYKKYLQGKTA